MCMVYLQYSYRATHIATYMQDLYFLEVCTYAYDSYVAMVTGYNLRVADQGREGSPLKLPPMLK